MGLADTAKLVVDLSLAGNFASSLGKAGKSLDTFDGKVSRTSSRGYQAGQQIGTGIKNGARLAAVGIGILATQVALGLRSLVQLEQATAQTEAVIKSTGGAAGVTAEQVRNLSEKYEALNATVGDEVIQSGQNLLLTFTAIGKDAFEPSLKAALDLSTALGTDLNSAITTVGKALSDPAKAMARLRRQGIILTKAEQKQIDAHLANNDALGAQSVIIAALDKRYGGSFLGKGATTAGKVAKFTDSIEDLQRSLAEALLPTLGNVADELSAFLQDPAVKAGVKDLGRDIAGLFSKENIRAGAEVIGGFLRAAKEAAPAIAAAAKVAGAVIGTAVKLFNSLPPEIQSLAVAGLAVNKLTGGLVTNIAGGLIGSVLKQLVSGVVNVNGGVVNVVGAGGLPGGAVGGAAGAAGTAAGLGTGAALGIAGVALGAAVVGAVNSPLWVKNTTLSAELEQQGLTQGERAAQIYYTASSSDQSQMRKHLANIPSKADWISGLAKLNKPPAPGKNAMGGLSSQNNDPDKRQFRSDKELKAEVGRVGAMVNAAKDDQVGAINTSKTAVTAAQAETKRATTTGSFLTSAATRRGSSAIVGAIGRIPAPIVNVNVTATTVTRSITYQNRSGNGSGSAGGAGNGPTPV